MLLALHYDWSAIVQQATSSRKDALALEHVSFASYSNSFTYCIPILHRLQISNQLIEQLLTD